MFSFIWPMCLAVMSNVAYQICAKSTPEGIAPLASLTVTYTTAAVVSGILFFVVNRGGNLLAEYAHLNWVPFVFGITLVGLEVGFIYMYKAGWPVSTAATVQSAFLAILLIFVGFALYHEAITWTKALGVGICLVGLYFINK